MFAGGGLFALRSSRSGAPRVRAVSHDPLRQLPYPYCAVPLQTPTDPQQLLGHLPRHLRSRCWRVPPPRHVPGADCRAWSALKPLRAALLLRNFRL